MVKQFMKKRSKRMSCRKKYKIEHKIRQHTKKVRKQAKKNPKKHTAPKDIGVPNSLPFKDKILQEAQLRKEMEEELKKKQKEERHELLMGKRGLKDLTEEADKKTKLFEEIKKQEVSSVPALDLRNFKPFYREFNKVVEAADVVLQVLDARDPLGSRCPQVEKAVLDSGPNKRLVFVLNKIDLVPNHNLLGWLKYLRNEFPTVPFKASTQMQKNHLSRQTLRLLREFDSEPTTTPCLGAELLMKLLGNYCRNKDIRTSIRVGVVGFPNVGKSSIINSLKRSRACNVGATPGVTRTMQEVQLDKHIVLLDSPGVVLAQKNKDEAGAALRNALKIETLEDAIPVVEAILRRTNVQQLMLYYRIAKFADSHEFLALMAKRFGRLKRGGVPDSAAAARHLIRDWNTGKIRYFTRIPEESERQVHVSAEIVTEMAKEFNVHSLESMELNTISNLHYKQPVGMVDAIEVEGMGCTDGTIEGLKLPADNGAVREVEMEDDSKITDSLGVVEGTQVDLQKKSKKSTQKPSKKTEAALLDETGMNRAENALAGNQCLNSAKKLALKKLRKKQKRTEKMTDKLSNSFLSTVSMVDAN